jgi:hypothetical protein
MIPAMTRTMTAAVSAAMTRAMSSAVMPAMIAMTAAFGAAAHRGHAAWLGAGAGAADADREADARHGALVAHVLDRLLDTDAVAGNVRRGRAQWARPSSYCSARTPSRAVVHLPRDD